MSLHEVLGPDGATGAEEAMIKDGAVILRGALEAERIFAFREELARACRFIGQPETSSWLDLRKSDIVAEVNTIRRAAYLCPSLPDLFRTGYLLTAVGHLLGTPEPYLHPRKWMRVNPGDGSRRRTVPAHQDYQYVRGSADTLTCWTPLHDCDRGGIWVLPGSHERGLLPTEADRMHGSVVGVDKSARAAPAMKVGDVLLFHSLTVHGTEPNDTGLNRLSIDARVQHPLDPIVDEQLLPAVPQAGGAPLARLQHADPRVWSGDEQSVPPPGMPRVSLTDGCGAEDAPSRFAGKPLRIRIS
jgi:ectoine hydroxylase-related dioxygenase (phytanoyl-CoA dioxygenase family)